jgi:hypothetical protein
MTACWIELTTAVATWNNADDDPAGIMTVAGTTAAGEEEASVTTAPPAGAGPLKVTVALTTTPEVTEDAARTMLEIRTEIGLTVSVACAVPPAYCAVIVACCGVLAGPPVTVKFAVVDPAGTTTVAGTVAASEDD